MAIEHKNIAEADLHEPKGVSTATAGKTYVSDGAGSGEWLDSVNPTSVASDIYKVYVSDGAGGGAWKLPTRMGWVDYNDLATATTPIPLTVAGTHYKLTNDGLGAFTNKTYKLPDMGEIWNTTTNRLDFSSLKVGDTVHFRIDVEAVTSGANHELDFFLNLGIGGTPYELLMYRDVIKTASTVEEIINFAVYMGDTNTLNNPAEILASSDGTGDTVKVNGWFIEVTSRGED